MDKPTAEWITLAFTRGLCVAWKWESDKAKKKKKKK